MTTRTHTQSDDHGDGANRPTDDQAIRLLSELVATHSISGREREAVELFVKHMAAMGLRTSIDEAGNAVGEVGSNDPDAAVILLLGHIDTVPGDIPVRIEDGVLHGRGAVDAKGPLSAFAIATARAAPRLALRSGGATESSSQDIRLTVIGAVGEETPDSPGAMFVRRQYRHHPPVACIIGEPSGWDRFTIGYKGRLIAEATIRVACSHSAGLSETAAERALQWWQHVQHYAERQNESRSGIFDAVQASLEAVNTSSDGMHEIARVRIGFRLPPDVPPDQVEQAVAGIDHDVAVRFSGSIPAVRVDRSNPIARALSAAIAGEGGRGRAVVKTGTSDMNTVMSGPDGWPLSECSIVAYGPGDSALDHTPNERVHLDEYLRAIRVLTGALRELTESVAVSR